MTGRERMGWACIASLFVVARLLPLVGDPSRFWAPEETFQSDIAVALAKGDALETLERYLYPLFAGGTLVENLLLVPVFALVGPSWWVLKLAALGVAFAASAVWCGLVRRTVGLSAALCLGLALAWPSPSSATQQMFLFGNHAEGGLLFAASAAGAWWLLQDARSHRERTMGALALGVFTGFSLFFVYSHFLVAGLLGVVLLLAPWSWRERGRLAGLGVVGAAGGLLPWVWARRALEEPLAFNAHLDPGQASLADAFARLPWLGTMDARPWLELAGPEFLSLGFGMMGAARAVLLAGIAGGVVVGIVRRLRGDDGWVLPLLVGGHGVLLFVALATTQVEPRYAQQLIPDGLVALGLLAGVGTAARRWSPLVLGVPLLAGVLDTLPLLQPPAPGLAPLASEGLMRFSRGRQSMMLQGFTREELAGIARWLERPPSDADLGFGLAFEDAATPLYQRLECSRPKRVELAVLDGPFPPPNGLDRTAMLEGYGAGATVRHCGDLHAALWAFDGVGEDRDAFARGARSMAELLGG